MKKIKIQLLPWILVSKQPGSQDASLGISSALYSQARGNFARKGGPPPKTMFAYHGYSSEEYDSDMFDGHDMYYGTSEDDDEEELDSEDDELEEEEESFDEAEIEALNKEFGGGFDHELYTRSYRVWSGSGTNGLDKLHGVLINANDVKNWTIYGNPFTTKEAWQRVGTKLAANTNLLQFSIYLEGANPFLSECLEELTSGLVRNTSIIDLRFERRERFSLNPYADDNWIRTLRSTRSIPSGLNF